MNFKAYSKCYDLLYTGKDYSAEVTYIDILIKRHVSAAKYILKLGCGTGAHAEYLARMGYHVRGLDMSKGMIERAQRRTEKHSMRYLFLPEIEQFTGPRFIVEGHYEWLKDSAPNHRSWTALTVLKKQTRAAFKSMIEP